MELFKSELMKIKDKKIYMLGALVPLPAIIISMNIMKNFKGNMGDVSALEVLISFSSMMYMGMLLPIFLLYTVIILNKIEGESNGWRAMLIMPVKRKDIFLNKYLVVLSAAFLSVVSYLAQNIIASIIVSKTVEVNIQIFYIILAVFISVLPFIGIVYFVADKCKSIVVTLVIGMLMVLSTIIIAQSKFWIFAPWTYPLVIGLGGLSTFMEIFKVIILSLGIFIVIVAIDLKIFLKKDFI